MDPQTSPGHGIIVRTPESEPKQHPILFVHGAWHGAWCWDEHFLDYFVQHGYQVWALDLRLHGTNTAAASLRTCRIADYVADLAAVVRSSEQAPILVAHSMGGLVAQKYLETASAPAAVLLASVPPQGALRAALRMARRIPWQFLKGNLQLRLYPFVETPQLAHAAFFSPTIPHATLLKYFRNIQDESYLAFLDMMLFNLPKPKRVTTPMLVLGGECDAIFQPHEFRATAAAYGTQAILFPDMAHDMMLEPGWQAVADTIIDWLAQRGL